MRNPSLLLLIVVFILAPFKLSAAADTVAVRETRIPVLIERQDNELFHLRIEAAQSQMLNEVKLDFGKDVNLTSNPQLSSSASFLRLNVLSSLN